METAEWLSLGALLVSIAVGVFGYLRNPPLVPAGAQAELRRRIEDISKECEELRQHTARCELQLAQLREDNLWLQRRLLIETQKRNSNEDSKSD